MIHQYIDRETSMVKDEELYFDRLIHFIYNNAKEKPGTFYKMLAAGRTTQFLSFLHYDMPGALKGFYARNIVNRLGIDLEECVDQPHVLNSPRKIFQRKIRYWETRPMKDDCKAVVSPADAKMLVGSFSKTNQLFLKEKFFYMDELLGLDKTQWLKAFHEGMFAVFRLTPEKYHYNHVPVSGKVLDIYDIQGTCHSCNPSAVVTLATPYSKNKRVVTIIDTDVPHGTQVGIVAMIEVTALLIGDILQCYSECRYDRPVDIQQGMFLKKGSPKSLYRPGSSVDVLIFQKNRMQFCEDIVANMFHGLAKSRLSHGFGRPLVETAVTVRSMIGTSINDLSPRVSEQ